MRRKTNKTPIIILLVLVLLVASLLGGMIWFATSHFFVGGKAYPKQAQSLDLRGQILSVAEYEQIREELPEAKIRWNIPFQNSAYPDDTTSLSVRNLTQKDVDMLAHFSKLQTLDAVGCREYDLLMQVRERYPQVELNYTVTIDGAEYAQDAQQVTCAELTDEDIALMAWLPELKSVDATGCEDYSRLAVLAEAYPDVDISYQVELLGQTFTEETESAAFKDPDVDVLMEKLAYLSGLESVHLEEPMASAEKLVQLTEQYPDITFTWDKTVLGKTFSSSQTEYDLTDLSLSGYSEIGWTLEPMLPLETEKIVRNVENAMAYFPNAEKVILPAYHFDNETMAEFREKMRPEYKVVWTVYVTRKPVRTDQEVIHSSAYKVCFIDEQSQDLKYCEDAIVVDIGHSYVKNIEWVKGMPKLKYLILTHNWLRDISPLSTCKNLEYLEIYWNDYVQDYSPLLECTALKDLNISGTYADRAPLKKMTWLENLWANATGMGQAEYEELCKALPNTRIECRGGDYTSNGWRQVQGYFDMRDIMGLPYNTW